MTDKQQQKLNIGNTFLDEVTDQISYKPIRASIRQELQEHLLDRIEDYESQGISFDEAQEKAVQDMGDAVQIGAKLNEVHSVQSITLPQVSVVMLLVIGFMLANFMQWNPEQIANGSYYYLIGIPFLFLVSWKGYPFFIKNWKKWTLILAVGMVLAVAASEFISEFSLTPVGIPSLRYCIVLLSVPLVVTGVYFLQHKTERLQYVSVALGMLLMIALLCLSKYVEPTVKMIFGLSLCGTIYFMIYRNIIYGKKLMLYLTSTFCTLLFGIAILMDSGQEMRIKTFMEPETVIQSTWDDAYNEILIQELLARTPWLGGLELSHDELLDYGTGAWYFAERDERQIGIIIPQKETEEERQMRKEYEKELRAEGVLIKYIYDAPNMELWDVLPQHYHNNYIFSVVMFMFGKIPGILLIVAVAGLVCLLSLCVHRIQGRLAASLSFCYLQCLVWQCVFYVLGNLGYQYGAFPSMPMLSEGRFSIFLNMFMLGMILSAYRYDHVLEAADKTMIWSIS